MKSWTRGFVVHLECRKDESGRGDASPCGPDSDRLGEEISRCLQKSLLPLERFSRVGGCSQTSFAVPTKPPNGKRRCALSKYRGVFLQAGGFFTS